uniref:Uncharacterized protein n=1 Tax=Oryza nivara TaxID=4536 RepID=A0A0E0GY32_ORYNI
MAQDGKLDLLLKTMAENEKKREEAEARTRAVFAELKLSLDVRLPAVEKKVETLNTVCKTLSAKVEQLEGSIALQRKDDVFAGKVTTAVYPEAHKEEPQDSRNFQSTPLHHASVPDKLQDGDKTKPKLGRGLRNKKANTRIAGPMWAK